MEFPDSILDFDNYQINSSQMKQFIEVNDNIFHFHSWKPVKNMSYFTLKPKTRN